MMRKIAALIVCAVVMPAMAGYEYQWSNQYQGGHFTEQVWTFDDGSNQPNSPFLPDFVNENPGNPTLSIDYTVGLGSGWSANWEGRNGVYFDPDGLGLTLDIPNYNNQNPLKVVVLQVEYRDAEFANAVLTSAGFVSMDMPVIEMGADGWNILTATWEICPNPDGEMIEFDLLPAGGTAAVNWVAVHTVCVPEPGTILLLLGGSLWAARRKK